MAQRGQDDSGLGAGAGERPEEKYLAKQVEALDSMTPEEYDRFEHFRRSHFPRPVIRRILEELLNVRASGGASPVSEDMQIIVACLAKLFVGDVTELARDVMREADEDGAITTTAIREAYRRAKRDGVFDTGSGRLKKRRLATTPVNFSMLDTSPSNMRAPVMRVAQEEERQRGLLDEIEALLEDRPEDGAAEGPAADDDLLAAADAEGLDLGIPDVQDPDVPIIDVPEVPLPI
mmetsp:Transcript_14795/g.44562  ORF Transcript_14795/g.44562 Transcript_14795/m.44562 type:complete len:234 (-) Transcript_14795:636-1337(-)|eukprot:CAMPEP_0118882816 /NCGR_PEP_ID=MMETSP1163-20130328/21985_1 /TAXON_ID=124430 /ORGANISM="Phaeomonas parva, Strain CCMP2877" /LENGTH=233 /DNA_ID=CAMNT_0006820011 /DNA_START=224 /DNA_END=925 /DNA_ORIENTATION=-